MYILLANLACATTLEFQLTCSGQRILILISPKVGKKDKKDLVILVIERRTDNTDCERKIEYQREPSGVIYTGVWIYHVLRADGPVGQDDGAIPGLQVPPARPSIQLL